VRTHQVVALAKVVELALAVREVVKLKCRRTSNLSVRWKRSSLPWVCG
jgi:hypothetical protein